MNMQDIIKLHKFFPRKKGVFFDCGSHYGEGLTEFIDMYTMRDPGWKAFSFEPNEDSFKRLIKATFKLRNIQFLKKAVWINDGTINFHAETPPSSATSDGAGSTIVDLHDWKPKNETNTGAGEFNNTYPVECAHLSRFIMEHCTIDDFGVLKLDVEGAEFEILDDLIKTDVIKYIDHLYVEFHEWAMPSKGMQSKINIIHEVRKANPKTKFTDWK